MASLARAQLAVLRNLRGVDEAGGNVGGMTELLTLLSSAGDS